MSNHWFNRGGRKLAVWGSLAVGLAQVGCAHQVLMEPHVVVSSRSSPPPVYGPVYSHGHAHAPQPHFIVPPPRPVYLPSPPPRVVYPSAPPRVVYHPAPPQVLYRPPVHVSPVHRPAPQWGSKHPVEVGKGGHREARDGRERREGERGHGRDEREREPWRR